MTCPKISSPYTHTKHLHVHSSKDIDKDADSTCVSTLFTAGVDLPAWLSTELVFVLHMILQAIC